MSKYTVLGVSFMLKNTETSDIFEMSSDSVELLNLESVSGNMLHTERRKLTVILHEGEDWVRESLEVEEDDEEEDDEEEDE